MSRFLDSRHRSLKAYEPGEQPRQGQFIKLNTNESPYPPSPRTIQRLSGEEVSRLNLYPDPEGTALRRAIAAWQSVSPEQVVLGNGSDEILSFAFLAFCGPGQGVAFPAVSYGFYPVYARLYGVDALALPLRPDFTIPWQDFCGLGRMVVLANPNAPTGLALPEGAVEELLRTNPDRVVLIDEAYVGFGTQSCKALLSRYDNLLIVRTFSKSHSMAGARLGFALCSPALAQDLNRVRYSVNPYNINRLTLLAGEAAVEDAGYYEQCCRQVANTRDHAAARLRGLGFWLTDSQTNFLFARHPALSGRALYEGLRRRGILVRHFAGGPVEDFVRITVGTPEQMDTLIAALEDLLP